MKDTGFVFESRCGIADKDAAVSRADTLTTASWTTTALLRLYYRLMKKNCLAVVVEFLLLAPVSVCIDLSCDSDPCRAACSASKWLTDFALSGGIESCFTIFLPLFHSMHFIGLNM